MKQFKPMLAVPAKAEQVVFPVYASPKIDGVRGTVRDGQLRSRSFKPFPNKYVQSMFSDQRLEGLDGEFVLGPVTAPDSFRVTNSAMMRIEGEPQVTFWVFDHTAGLPSDHFTKRYVRAQGIIGEYGSAAARVEALEHTLITTVDELLALEEDTLAMGFEGLILRRPSGLYKYGRSTLNEQGMLKFKRMDDSEAVIVGIYEQMHNTNEAKLNELGYTERSSHKENMVPAGTMGYITVRDVNKASQFYGIEFNIGTGFSAAERAEFWANREFLIGVMVKYAHFPIGVKDKPRHPSYKGFRSPIDLGE